jgi:tRNA dimethylallyltransferase
VSGAPAGPGGPRLLVVVGPTAVGKSELAIELCERFGGEVVSVDSMQVYRGLDRGTAKPDPETRRRVPHHGIDLVDPGEDFSLGDFVRAGGRAIAEIRGRGALPVLVGGTGLYLRGLMKGIVDAPPRHPRLRRRLEAIASARGVSRLHGMLARRDPEAAARIGVNDRQRIARALEVLLTARRPLPDLIRDSPFGADRLPAVKIGLEMDRAALYRRIDERVERFFASGLLEEVRSLVARGYPASANAFKVLGYRESLRHLRGECSLAEAIALTQRNTRRYAKRQWTWFRKEEGVTWFEVDPLRTDRFAEPHAFAARSLGSR